MSRMVKLYVETFSAITMEHLLTVGEVDIKFDTTHDASALQQIVSVVETQHGAH